MEMGKRSVLLLLSFLFLSPLAAEPDWLNLKPQDVITKAKQQKTITTDRLWYESSAYETLGDFKNAYGALSLFLAMADAKDVRLSLAEHRLVALSFKNGLYGRCIELFDGQKEKTIEDARYCYQAAMACGNTAKASSVFSTYLKSTVDQYTYATMLVSGMVPIKTVMQESEGLEPDKKLELLCMYQDKENSPDDAQELLSEGQRLEGVVKEPKTLYHVLVVFAEQAGQRVLARRYQKLEMEGNPK